MTIHTSNMRALFSEFCNHLYKKIPKTHSSFNTCEFRLQK
jgi:hypothetical protein